MTFGSYWCYDIPSAIQTELKKKFQLSSAEYSYLYSVYNFMNIGIVLFGGYFIDVIGLRLGSILFCFLIALGQLVVSLGASMSNIHTAYYIMLAGRVIFSLGGESLSVAQSTYCSRWFKGSELAFSFGVTLSFSRIGSFTNLDVTPIFAQHWGVTIAIWCGTLTCLVSLALTLFAAFSDKVKESHSNAQMVLDGEVAKPKIPFRVSDILHFPPSLWLLYLICVCYYVPIFTLISLSGLGYLEARVGLTQDPGNRYLSIPYVMSACLAPFCGFAVDRVGYKPLWLAITSGLMVGTYAILLFLLNAGINGDTMVIVAMVVLGLSYSLCASSLWPCVPLLVPEERVGTAYAIMNSIQNAGLAIAAVIAGQLGCPDPNIPSTLSCARPPLYFLSGVAVASTALSILLVFWDFTHGSILARKSIKAVEVSEKTPLIPNSSDGTFTVNA